MGQREGGTGKFSRGKCKLGEHKMLSSLVVTKATIFPRLKALMVVCQGDEIFITRPNNEREQVKLYMRASAECVYIICDETRDSYKLFI